LPDHASDCSRRSGHRDGVALAQAPHVEEPEVGGEPREPERAEIGGQRRERRVDLGHAGTVAERVFLNPEGPIDVIAGREARMLGGSHAPHGTGSHDLADLNRLDVRRPRIHPSAHGRVDRDVADRDHELPGLHRRNRLFGELPALRRRQSGWPFGEADLVVELAHT
jgi:hypothetical protein